MRVNNLRMLALIIGTTMLGIGLLSLLTSILYIFSTQENTLYIFFALISIIFYIIPSLACFWARSNLEDNKIPSLQSIFAIYLPLIIGGIVALAFVICIAVISNIHIN